MWKITLSPQAAQWLREVDSEVARRIRSALRAVGELDNPRSRGKRLSGSLAGLWRYRVGKYRILCDIHDTEMVILAVEIGKRDEIDD